MFNPRRMKLWKCSTLIFDLNKLPFLIPSYGTSKKIPESGFVEILLYPGKHRWYKKAIVIYFEFEGTVYNYRVFLKWRQQRLYKGVRLVPSENRKPGIESTNKGLTSHL